MAKQFVTTKSAETFTAEQLHARHVAEIRALIESGDVDPQKWYDAFRDAQGRDTTLDDDELIDCMADDDGNADDTDTPAGFVRLMLAAETQQDAEGETEEEEAEVEADKSADKPASTKDVSVSGQKIEGQKVKPKDIEDRMAEIAAILNGDTPDAKALREEQTKALDAPVTQKMGPVRVLMFFRSLFKGSNAVPLALWPLPYSVEKPDNKNPIKCETLPNGKPNPDIYKAWRKTDKGKSVSKQQSAYGTLVDDTDEGIAIKAKRAAIAKAKEGKTDNSKWAKMYVGWGQYALDTEDSSLQSRRTRLITMYRQSISMERQFEAFKELSGAEARFITVQGATKDEPRVVVAVMKPIAIIDKLDTTNFHTVSVSTFLSIDVRKAADDGGSYEDVKNNTGNQDTDEEANNETKWDYDTFSETLPTLLAYMTDHNADIRRKLATKKIEDSAEMLVSLWETALECANICKQYGLEGVDDLKVKEGSRIDKANQSLPEALGKSDAA